jgi:branched-chain amino acid transport system substrate-binding protein
MKNTFMNSIPSFVFVVAICALPIVSMAQNEAVKLGQIVPLSGSLANVGKEIQAATQAAIAQHNASSKPRIELIVEDDGNNPERSAAAVELLASKTTALLSCFGTVGCLAQMKASQALGLPLIGPIAGAPQLRGKGASNVFAIRASASEELARLVQFSQTMSLNELAVVVQDDGFGRAYFEALKLLLVGSGIQLQAMTLLNPQKPDYAANVAELTKENPRGLLLLANATHSVGVLQAWRAKTQLPFVMNLSGQANGFFANGLKGYKGAAAFVTATPNPWGRKYAMQREYHTAMDAAGQQSYSYLSFEAYTNARITIDAIKRAKGRSPTALKAALDNSSFAVAGIEWRFDSGNPTRFTDMAVLKTDGTFSQ